MADQKTTRTSCLGGFSIIWVPKLLLTPLKIRIFGPKTAKFGQKDAFLVILGHFAQDTYLLNPIKIRLFGPKTAKIGPKSAFLVILGQILPFFAHFVQCPTKKQCEQGA